MEVSATAIDTYLQEVKNAIREDRYRIELNSSRQDNRDLFFNYILTESGAKTILLGLERNDFSEILQNEHQGFEHELLYVFGKDVELAERIGNRNKMVHLYIKLNKIENHFVIVVSMHERKFPIKYYFVQC